MDRTLTFVTHLSHLVAMHAREPVDVAAATEALRAAGGAAHAGGIDLVLDGRSFRSGDVALEGNNASAVALAAIFGALGVRGVRVGTHVESDEVTRLAQVLARAIGLRSTPHAFALAVAERAWSAVTIDCAVAASDAAVQVQDPAAEAAPPAASVGDVGMDAEPTPGAEPLGRPLAETVPAAVDDLVVERHRALFERLITASEPGTLRRLLEPVTLAVEQTVREGQIAESLRLLLALFVCESLAAEEEMRRQFLVVLRRLTKPTLLRAYAAWYTAVPEDAAAVEHVLVRFGVDGAEAVADRVACAPTATTRNEYLALLARLPGTNAALLAMLEDDRLIVIERAIELMTLFKHPDLERVLGEGLSHASVRVRQAATRGLSQVPTSAFAADALARAVQDPMPEVRREAAVALQSRVEARLAPAIVSRIEEETELDVQLALVTALGRIVAPEGVQKLIALSSPDQRLLRRRDTTVMRLSAIEALGEARTPAAMVALQKLLEDRDKDVREAAARLYTRARRQTSTGSIPVVTDAF